MSESLNVSATPREKKQKRGGKLLHRRADASERELGEVGRSAGEVWWMLGAGLYLHAVCAGHQGHISQ